MSEQYEAGMVVRREVLGDEYVDRALANATEFSAELQTFVTEYCWGGVWTRDGLPRATRSLLNLAMITALNRPHELRAHVIGALRNGCTEEQIREVLLQATVYCGVPAGVDAFRVASAAITEHTKESKAP
ncbi:carboxymuconolactone decarboxylase family protein [Dactylosporangium sp. AC04546]|uniref:carboxymuconolactone decarboxylase family protein n=1 Tax=Dactylosporangium sp. AC04546 TaxID=2862460 RepID=UPI001EE01272|nr:carboxymuconolactone decarboxylase family protein [Dactylosporangium sp. AC04546]WVK89035.1 carboxymuconolactone decarboxylase family protein [Dactylosporangium sp. AC04546]